MTDAKPDPKVEIAHVLTMDLVEYSTLLITEQTRIMAELTGIVRSTVRFQQAEAEGKLIRIPIGDGMVLVFFNDSEAPIECYPPLCMSILPGAIRPRLAGSRNRHAPLSQAARPISE